MIKISSILWGLKQSGLGKCYTVQNKKMKYHGKYIEFIKK